jgi:hypothetical protein
MTINFPPSFAKSWKSTLVGLVAAIWAVVSGLEIHDWSAAVHDHGIQTKVMLAVLGFIVKDGNVTGGTVGQPSTPQALAEANQEPAKGADAPKLA